jgi:hydrogenase expression/formation protein HypD
VVRQAAGETQNFSVLVAHKLVPPALGALVARPDFSVDGFICPGHVSAIIGSDAYRFLAERHHIPCVVAGFEPVDILLTVLMLLRQIKSGRAEVEVEYRSVVRSSGNPHAQELLASIFQPEDSQWRGVGMIPGSGLKLRPAYQHLDALQRFSVEVQPAKEPQGCLCGKVLVGAVRPPQCVLFGKVCTPQFPVGPCMVSSEGTCAAYYKYQGASRE